MNITAVLCVRNEAAFLLPWLAHHRACGISHFVVFSNDCDDGTDAMLDHLQALGWLDHVRNPGPYDQRGIQFTALNKAQDHPAIKTADWLLPFDIDEYVNVKTGAGTLADLMAAMPEATAITLTWRLFGNAGHVRYADVPVTERFTRCAPQLLHWPWRAAMFKTLYKNDGTYRKLGVHRPRDPDPARLPDARWFDGAGRELDDAFKTKRIFSILGRSNTDLVQLNHYPLGTLEDYVLKAARGRAVHSSDRLGLDYWVERNFNTDTCTDIARLTPMSRPILDRLMADATLRDLHARAVAWRHAQFEHLMAQEPYRALFGRLLMAAPTQPVSARAARFLIQHAQRGHAAKAAQAAAPPRNQQ